MHLGPRQALSGRFPGASGSSSRRRCSGFAGRNSNSTAAQQPLLAQCCPALPGPGPSSSSSSRHGGAVAAQQPAAVLRRQPLARGTQQQQLMRPRSRVRAGRLVALDKDGSDLDDSSVEQQQPPMEPGLALPQDAARLGRSDSSSSSQAPPGDDSIAVCPPGISLNSSSSSSPNSSRDSSSSSRNSSESSSSSSQSPGGSDDDGSNATAVVMPAAAAAAIGAAGIAAAAGGEALPVGVLQQAPLYPPAERSQIQESWGALMRWSKLFRRAQRSATSPIEAADKVVVFGGGSFGTAMGSSLATKRSALDVVLLLRDPQLCADINTRHVNTKYLADFTLPSNVRATTDAAEAIAGASYAVHAVPVQHSRAFLAGVAELLPKDVPIICVSKGLEVGTGCMMSEVIPSALGRRQPAVFLSGPSFAKEVMQGRPTGVVAACKDLALAREVQELFASPVMRVNTTSDVTGVEICGALKNVLAIAAGIVEGLELGHNALAALISQGCAEIRWLSQKVGAKSATIGGLSGLGDIMLTCYGDLSRNRAVGVRLGRGEALADILASSSQVAEGVATAGVVVGLARKYRVSLPVLTAVAQVLDAALTPAQAVTAVMNLPQVEER